MRIQYDAFDGFVIKLDRRIDIPSSTDEY